MRKMLLVVAALTATLACVLVAWRRDRRLGSRFVNESINPLLVRRGLAGVGHSELGTLEHIGRRSGTRRLTPVHPVVSGEEVRIVVPLGAQSEWARNVLAAGRCRIQLHDEVLELDEPALVPAGPSGTWALPPGSWRMDSGSCICGSTWSSGGLACSTGRPQRRRRSRMSSVMSPPSPQAPARRRRLTWTHQWPFSRRPDRLRRSRDGPRTGNVSSGWAPTVPWRRAGSSLTASSTAKRSRRRAPGGRSVSGHAGADASRPSPLGVRSPRPRPPGRQQPASLRPARGSGSSGTQRRRPR